MSRRLKITLPDALATQLDELAANAGEPVARLAGQMVRQGIAGAGTGEHVPAAQAQPAPVVLDAYDEDEPEQRASWLEP
jgi:predicted transcriptional regulator